MSFKPIPSHVIQCVSLTPLVSQIILQAEGFSFEAGQYIEILHASGEISPLSIASAPGDLSQLELHLSHPAKNTKALSILKTASAGGNLSIRGPFGSCTTAKLSLNYPIIFYVRGTGFAPVKAILENLLQDAAKMPAIHLFWGAPTEADFYLQPLLQKWKQAFPHFQYSLVLSRTVDQHKLPQAVVAAYPDLSACQIYASGPPDMVFAALEDFTKHGARREWFYSDVFDYASPG